MKTTKLLLLAAALFFLTSCVVTRTEPTKAENADAPTAPQTAGADATGETAAESSSAAIEPQTSSPDAVIKDLYNVHGKDNGKILNGKNRALLDKYFDKNLANLIWKELTTQRDEVGVLDFDIFYNAQDIQIKNLVVRPAKIENNKAEVVVNFTNFTQKETITYPLTQQNGAWKISDIKYRSGDTLLKYFKEYENSSNAEIANSGGEFEGTYQVGETTCTVTPVKMAFEVKWAKGSGSEIFHFANRENDRYIYMTDGNGGKVNIFALNEGFDSGEFIRGDGKRFPVKKIK